MNTEPNIPTQSDLNDPAKWRRIVGEEDVRGGDAERDASGDIEIMRPAAFVRRKEREVYEKYGYSYYRCLLKNSFLDEQMAAAGYYLIAEFCDDDLLVKSGGKSRVYRKAQEHNPATDPTFGPAQKTRDEVCDPRNPTGGGE